MSIPINTDNSVQLSYSSFPFAISDIDNYATSNFVSNVSNVLRSAINTKQDTLTAATNLLGVGTSITAIDYNKVSVNKPTNFQADWNSTIINKPTIYTQSQIDTFLNAKQNNLTAATTLLGTGGSITGINYNTVINKPTYSTPLSSNIATNTISIDLTNYYNQTQVNTAIIGSSNYSLNISNVLKSNIDANNTAINTAIGNSSNYALNISNILTTRDATDLTSSSNYSLNISNILTTRDATNLTSSSNYSLNISNILKANIDANNTAINTAIGNSSNYALNISNILTTRDATNLTSSSNYSLNISNVLKANIDANNTAINTAIGNASNYSLNISNILTSRDATNLINSSNYASNISNVLLLNNTNIINSSNYASNISNIIITNTNANYLKLSGGTLSGTLTAPVFNLTTSATGNNVLFIRSSITNANNCIHFQNDINNNVYVGICGSTHGAGTYQNNFFIESANAGIVLNTQGRTSSSPPNFFINSTGNIGIGTSVINSKLVVYGTTQLQPKISLTGIEYYTGANTNGNGIGLMLGVNRTDNRQLFICDTAKTAINTTNCMIRMGINPTDAFIDCMATDAATRKGLNVGNAFYCQANNYGSIFKFLKFHGGTPGDNRAVMENLIFTEGAMVGGVFGGDVFITGYWGVAINLNNGGFTNGIGGGNNSQSYDAGYSSFTINMRSSGTQTTFDKRLFTVRPDGATTINGTLTINGNVGIGTQPTLQKLEVNGPTNFTGSLSVQSADLHTFKSPGGLGGNFNCAGNITCLLYAITNSGTDYVGVGNASSGNNQNYLRQLYIMFETFTGFHRCFTNDELFDNENPQLFKDTYIGRIVVSTGKIATDFKSIDNDDWEIKYDKEGITIEDALPMIELSRKKKDKRVFGVLGNSKRNNSRSERLIINSVGEGGIWICNSNGNIENGDYIQSSDHLGYGEKQDDDLLHNYTVAKATMDCDFELDNPLYNCFELDDGLRVAFVAATYHCG